MGNIPWKVGSCYKDIDRVYYKRRSRRCKEPDDKCIPKPGVSGFGPPGSPVLPESKSEECELLQEQSVLSACDCCK